MNKESSTHHPFLKVLGSYRDLVWIEIEKYLELDPEELYSLSSKEVGQYKSKIDFQKKLVTEYPKRKGKYFRPSLVMLVTEILGVSPKEAVKTAAAMQLSEEWLLIQDDWEDRSLKRRGKPTLHRLYNPELAVNTSLVLQLLMNRIQIDNRTLVGPDRAEEIDREFNKMLLRAGFGQMIEIKTTMDNDLSLTEDDVVFIMKGKTGYYTVAGPIMLGCILGKAEPELRDKFFDFGMTLGVAYQMVDDILDMEGDFDGRKIQYNDIYEGKRTIMLAHLLQSANEKDRHDLEYILKKSRSEKTDEDVLLIIGMMNEYKCLNHARKLAARYIDEAKTLFKELRKDLEPSKYVDQLADGIDFVLNRKY